MATYTFTVYTLSASINGTFTVTGSFSVTVDDSDDALGIGDDSPVTETGALPTITSVGPGAPAAWTPGATIVFGGSRELDNSGGIDAILPKINGAWQFETAVQYPGAGVTLTVNETYNTTGFFNVDEEVIPVCFAFGTSIRTPTGDVLVERLAAGDMVTCQGSGPQEILWIGSTTVQATKKVAPIVFTKGSIGNDRELRVSPNHRMMVSGWKCQLLFGQDQMLCPAKNLVNGDTIYARPGGLVTYFHIMFAQHQIIYGNGSPSESFHPGISSLDGLGHDTRQEVLSLFPELKYREEMYGMTAVPSVKDYEAKVLAHPLN